MIVCFSSSLFESFNEGVLYGDLLNLPFAGPMPGLRLFCHVSCRYHTFKVLSRDGRANLLRSLNPLSSGPSKACERPAQIESGGLKTTFKGESIYENK